MLTVLSEVEGCTFEIIGVPDSLKVDVTTKTVEPGVTLVDIKLSANTKTYVSPIYIKWSMPSIEISGSWTPAAGFNKGKKPEWASDMNSKATSNAPVICLFGGDGSNRLTSAYSDTLNLVKLRAGVHEETGQYWHTLTIFSEPGMAIETYSATLRLDSRNIPYHRSLDEVSKWWSSLAGMAPAFVPETARLPMYSTWYSFHQELDVDAVVEECRVAAEMGCEAVIVDDGWQTMDNKRGYAYCGDWKPDRISDMRGFVDKIHNLGMKFILWYSVPFVGIHSDAYELFKDKLLSFESWAQAGVLDPRYPEVREFLITTYEKAMVEWGLDGFKLDFVDSFNPTPETALAAGGGRDIQSVPEAVDRLLTDVMCRLRAIKQDVLIEFRQSYVGPLMRKYGNMFRVGDCPNDQGANRVGSIDIRLICGNTAAHSDMVMWHPNDTVESAAMQLIHSLFCVPQVSVRLQRLPSEQLDMTKFWLSFWRDNRDVLLDGILSPEHPEMLYPIVKAVTAEKLLAAVFASAVVNLGCNLPKTVTLVNGTTCPGIVLRLEEDMGLVDVLVVDCKGNTACMSATELKAGMHHLDVPAGGVAWLRR